MGSQGGQNPLATMFPHSIFGAMDRAQREQQQYQMQMQQYTSDLRRQQLADQNTKRYDVEAGGFLTQFGNEPDTKSPTPAAGSPPGPYQPGAPGAQTTTPSLDLRYALKAMKNVRDEDKPHVLNALMPYMKQEDKEVIERAKLAEGQQKQELAAQKAKDLNDDRRIRRTQAQERIQQSQEHFEKMFALHEQTFNAARDDKAKKQTYESAKADMDEFINMMKVEAQALKDAGDAEGSAAMAKNIERYRKQGEARLQQLLQVGLQPAVAGAGATPPAQSAPPPPGSPAPQSAPAAPAAAPQSAPVAPAAAPQSRYPRPASAPQGPKPGDVIKGYRFKGGDPSSEQSWEKMNAGG